MYTGINSTDVKERNRGLLLRLLCCEGAASRIEMSRKSGLSKMAITNIISQLIADGWIRETHLTETSRAGRNPMGLALSEEAPCVLGVYISREGATAVLADACCTLLSRNAVAFHEESKETFWEKIHGVVLAAYQHAGKRVVLGIGIAAIGPLDCEKGILLNPRNFYGISNMPIGSMLSEAFGLPVVLNNDMNAAALAEALFSPQHTREFLYVGISHGVGAGIISDGRLYQNTGGLAGEIGHVGVDENGPLCSCGRHGCLELYVSMPAIRQQAAEIMKMDLQELTPARLSRVLLMPACMPVIRQVERHLEYVLTGAVNLLNPEAIIIGHEGVYLPDVLLARLEQGLNRGILASGYRHIAVRRAAFGKDAPLAGSVCCVLEKVFCGHLYEKA